jgi:hypothetical protein
MAWWTIGIHDDEMGDQPANLVEIALDEFAAARLANGKPLPTPKEFLDAFARSLARQGDPGGIEELTEGRAPILHPGSGSDADPELGSLLEALVDKLKQCYRKYRDREARPAELCAVIAFVLRHRPDRFLSEAENWALRDLAPAPGSSKEGAP